MLLPTAGVDLVDTPLVAGAGIDVDQLFQCLEEVASRSGGVRE
jgi:hypothetical protein